MTTAVGTLSPRSSYARPRNDVTGRLRWSDRYYWHSVVFTAAVAAAMRAGYILGVARYNKDRLYDWFNYELNSAQLSSGHFFNVIFGYGPDASHPPLTAISITPTTYFFGFPVGVTPQRMTMGLYGVITVVAVALLGRAVAGSRVGIVAGLLAALYPNIWIANSVVMSETLSMLLMALTLLTVYRLLRAPTFGNAALLGLLCGGEVLVHEDLIFFIPFLLVPAAFAAKGPNLRRKVAIAGVAIGVSIVTVMPWVGRNLATFQDPTYLSTGNGVVLAGANCPVVYSGPFIGAWAFGCVTKVHVSGDQSVASARYQHVAVQYIEHHLDRLPVVVAARVGRVWDFFQPIQQARDDNEGRPFIAAIAGLAMYYVLLPLGIVGIVALRRRRLTQWPLLVPAGVVTLASALAFGLVRFRAPFEISLVVLAAAGIDGLLGLSGRRRERRDQLRATSARVGNGNEESAAGRLGKEGDREQVNGSPEQGQVRV